MNMQTGFGDECSGMVEQYIKTMTDILLPVIEKSTLLAAEYCKACGRDVLLPEDMKYAIKYCAMYTVGQDIGSLFPEIYDDEDEDEESDEDEEDYPPFERYTGEDERFIRVNQAYDRWDTWVPQNPTEHMLKNAINSNEHL
jgi:hypothetical protein